MSDALLHYTRARGRPPVDHEVLTVAADGMFTLWRSIAIASNPPTPVGRFGGSTDVAAIQAAAHELAGEESLPLPPGASTETVRVGAATLTGPNDGRVPEQWQGVVTVARALLGELTAAPIAALALQADPPALVHLGAEPLRADLSRATLRVVTWDGPAVIGATETALSAAQDELAPGWSLPLQVPPAEGTAVTIEVNDLRLHDGTDWHDAALSLHVD